MLLDGLPPSSAVFVRFLHMYNAALPGFRLLHHDHSCGAVIDAARIAGRNRSSLVEGWADHADAAPAATGSPGYHDIAVTKPDGLRPGELTRNGKLTRITYLHQRLHQSR